MTPTRAVPTGENQSAPSSRWIWAICIVLTLLRLWLTLGLQIFAIMPSPHDDQHFLLQASHILRGEWLGPYDVMTLIKGPFFPMWIAGAFVLGIPLLLSVQVLYAGACWVFVLAVRPILRRAAYVPALFAWLLFNPATFGEFVTRVQREMITPALLLLAMGCAFRLLIAATRDGIRTGLWSIGLGLALGALWLTREEEAVVLPFFALVCAAALYRAFKARGASELWAALRPWLAAGLIWGTMNAAVNTLNYTNYGLFAKTEFDAYPFEAAYGALSRVKPASYKPRVPVAKETRMRIYRYSAAFREIEPILEGPLGAAWEHTGAYMADNTNRGEILGAWFMWAFRASVAAAGYYEHGKFPAEYYLRLASEVNAACAAGKLDCYPPRATMAPVWRARTLAPTLSSIAQKTVQIATFQGLYLQMYPSVGWPDELAFVQDITRNETTPSGQYYIEIEAADPNLGLEILVKDAKGDTVPVRYRPSQDPAFARYVQGLGIQIQPDSLTHFDLAAQCDNTCQLDFSSGDEALGTIGFDKLQPTVGVVRDGELVYRIVSVQPPVGPARFPLQAGLQAAKLAVLRWLLVIYQDLSPLLSVLAVLAFAYLTLRAVTSRTIPDSWLLLIGLVLLLAGRIALVAYINVASFAIGPGDYVFEAFPALLGFTGLGCILGIDAISRGIHSANG